MIDYNQAEKLSDDEIVNLALNDQDYFLLIINRYKLKLYNFIRRISNVSNEDVEDLLQEVFLKIYLNLNDFDKDLKFSTWVYAIARNQTISNHRKLQARAEGHKVYLEDESVEKLIYNFDIQKSVDDKIQKEMILKILDNINKKYREVLILKFLEEKDYQEISDIIKRPVGTVGSMLNQAKKEFKQAMEKLDRKNALN